MSKKYQQGIQRISSSSSQLEMKGYNYFDERKAEKYIKSRLNNNEASNDLIGKIIEPRKSKDGYLLPLYLRNIVSFLKQNQSMSLDFYKHERISEGYVRKNNKITLKQLKYCVLCHTLLNTFFK